MGEGEAGVHAGRQTPGWQVATTAVETLGLYHVLPGSRATVAVAGAEVGRRSPDPPLAAPELSLRPLDLAARTPLPRHPLLAVGVNASVSAESVRPLQTLLDEAREDGRLRALLAISAAAAASSQEALFDDVDVVRLSVPTLSAATAARLGVASPSTLARQLAALMRRGVWVEVTTVVTPGVNDDLDELGRVAEELARHSREIPWHVLAAGQRPSILAASDPLPALPRALEVGAGAGLSHVYTPHLPDEGHELTFCGACDAVVMERFLTSVVSLHLSRAAGCGHCGASLPGRLAPGMDGKARTAGGP